MNGYSLNDLTFAMMEHDKGHPKLIQHFLKVHAFARLIGEGEKLDEKLLFTLETACIVHDIGILPAILPSEFSEISLRPFRQSANGKTPRLFCS